MRSPLACQVLSRSVSGWTIGSDCEFREVGKEHEAKPVRVGSLRSFVPSFQDDQLLAQQSVFHDQIDTVAG